MDDTYEFDQVDNWNLAFLVFAALFTSFFADQWPQFVQTDGWAEFVVGSQMEISHTQFTEVSRMVFVEVDTVMMHTASITTTTRMLTMFAYNLLFIH